MPVMTVGAGSTISRSGVPAAGWIHAKNMVRRLLLVGPKQQSCGGGETARVVAEY